MTKNAHYRLCGGIFFMLVSNARKQMPKREDFYKGKQTGLSEPNILLNLSRIIVPDLKEFTKTMEQSVKDATRDFKICKSSGGNYFMLDDARALKNFDNDVKSNYAVTLARMNDFIEQFLDVRTSTKKDEYLVKDLVELLDADSDIDDDVKFYANPDGSAMTKREILDAKKLYVQSFILGLWHYCLVTLRDNTVGKDTYNEFCPPAGGSERKYTKNLGVNSKRNIEIRYCKAETPAEGDSCFRQDMFDDTSEENSSGETYRGSREEQATSFTQQIVNSNPLFIQQIGDCNTLMPNYGMINLTIGGKKGGSNG